MVKKKEKKKETLAALKKRLLSEGAAPRRRAHRLFTFTDGFAQTQEASSEALDVHRYLFCNL